MHVQFDQLRVRREMLSKEIMRAIEEKNKQNQEEDCE
jgi:hypothetical protein